MLRASRIITGIKAIIVPVITKKVPNKLSLKIKLAITKAATANPIPTG